MTKQLDVRGPAIGGYGVHAIVRSVLYKALSADGDDIEVWEEYPGPVLPHYWLVSHMHGFPRRLALVRYDMTTDELQERIEGPFGSEMWIDVPWGRGEVPST